MNRKVHAILISVPQSSKYATVWIPGADEAMERFAAMLEARFTDPPPTLQIMKRPEALQANVTAAFDEAVGRLSGDDLFVVLFIGHGRGSDGDKHPYEAWVLDDSEFSDRQLADYLSQLVPTVEVVVVSDSCYGGGFVRPGPTSARDVWSLLWGAFEDVRDAVARSPWWLNLRALELQARAQAWSPFALQHRASRPTALTSLHHMVCIAAAAWWDEVNIWAMPRLIDMTIAAARSNSTYGGLADAFFETAVTGATFELYARPNDRMCTPLLALHSPTHEKEHPMSAQPAEGPAQTRMVFVNYGNDTSTVELILKEDVALDELPALGQPDGAHLSARGPTGNCTLTLKTQVIAGFSVRTVVQINSVDPRTDMIAWRGKDPPVPPPPVLPRYKDTPGFPALFLAFLTVGGVDGRPQVAAGSGSASTEPLLAITRA